MLSLLPGAERDHSKYLTDACLCDLSSELPGKGIYKNKKNKKRFTNHWSSTDISLLSHEVGLRRPIKGVT